MCCAADKGETKEAKCDYMKGWKSKDTISDLYCHLSCFADLSTVRDKNILARTAVFSFPFARTLMKTFFLIEEWGSIRHMCLTKEI